MRKYIDVLRQLASDQDQLELFDSRCQRITDAAIALLFGANAVLLLVVVAFR